MRPDLRHIDAWLFDLDDTLYPLGSGFMKQVEQRMTGVVARLTGLSRDDAFQLRAKYLQDYGATTYGMIKHHNIDAEAFLDEVHDVPLDNILPDPALGEALRSLPGRRLIFTNSDIRHTGRVLARLGIEDLFDGIFHIALADYVPKPQPATFARMMAHLGLHGAATAFFEDSLRNLKPAHDLGMTTVLVGPKALETEAAFVHHRTTDLTAFLMSALVSPSLRDTMTDISAADLEAEIEAGWEARDTLNTATRGPIRTAVDESLLLLDSGRLRVAEKFQDEWVVRQWLKKAILLSFRLNPNSVVSSHVPGPYWDKVPTKFEGWGESQFTTAGFRAVPGAVVRRGAYIAKNAVLMPSFVNIGAYVDEGTMVDTWATVGSCAQIGKHVHLSGGAGIGGVLEPLQANPTIIEDGCFIGARSEVAEGVIVGEGAVLSMGVFLSASTKIVDRVTGEVHRGKVPPYSVVVPGFLPGKGDAPGLSCAVIVKTVDAQTRSKTSVNELLRD